MRRVLDPLAHVAGALRSGQPVHEVQGHLDAGRDPGRRHDVAVVDVRDAAPQLGALAEALGTSGAGSSRLSAVARNLGPGWRGVEVAAQANSPSGTLAGVPFERLATEYRYLDRGHEKSDGAGHRTPAAVPELNRWKLGADTAALGGQQRLSGVWNFGGRGQVDWRGQLLGAPLDLSASVAREQSGGQPADIASVRGSALGGPVQGRAALSGRVIELSVRPALPSLSGDLSLSGRAGDLTLEDLP